MAKKEKTFADRAKEIKKSYPRADWDSMERKDMLKELSELRDEQEEARAIQGIADHADNIDTQMAMGGVVRDYTDKKDMYGYFANSLNLNTQDNVMSQNSNHTYNTYPKNELLKGNLAINKLSDYGDALNSYGAIQGRESGVTDRVYSSTPTIAPELKMTGTKYFNDQVQKSNISNLKAPNVGGEPSVAANNLFNSLENPQLVDASSNNLKTLEDKYQLPQTSALPFAISAGMSAIGDIAGLMYSNKNTPKSVSLPRVQPTKIDLQPQREALQRGYNTASNVMLKNSRDVSSPVNAYANQIAGTSQLMDSFGTQMGQSYMNEANTNAQYADKASQANAEIGSREAIMNAQLKTQKNQNNAQYINSLANTIPMAMRDYNQQSNQTNMMNLMGKDYGMYEKINPNETFTQRMARLMNNSPKYIKNRYGVENNNSI